MKPYFFVAWIIAFQCDLEADQLYSPASENLSSSGHVVRDVTPAYNNLCVRLPTLDGVDEFKVANNDKIHPSIDPSYVPG